MAFSLPRVMSVIRPSRNAERPALAVMQKPSHKMARKTRQILKNSVLNELKERSVTVAGSIPISNPFSLTLSV